MSLLYAPIRKLTGLAIPAALLAALWAGTTVAYERYNDGCQNCHGSFYDATSPKGTVFPEDSKHAMHDLMIVGCCCVCHTWGDYSNPFIGRSNGTEHNPGVGCTGCHGRDYGGTIGNSGVGLRAHHVINGVTECLACHSNDPAPLPENVQPTYYGTPDVLVEAACDPGPDHTEN